ncbi:MAG: DegV family protein [Clostridiales bacterium]|nr:DegV family protein [Clostridiales bacterium]
MDYVIATDSTCDLPKDFLSDMQVSLIEMTYTVNDISYGGGEADGLDFKQFYDAMRKGARTGTSMINEERAREFLNGLLATGKNVLYLCFASVLSGTYDNFRRVAEELNAQNENKVYVVDSKCASGGEGLYVALVAEKRDSGMSFTEICEYSDYIRDHVLHYFVVEDLQYLARGGRLSKGSAFVGNMLNIKPVLHVDEDGRLIPIKKVMGRKKSISMMITKMEERYNKESDKVFITHADCYDEAKAMADIVAEKFGITPQIFPLGYVIGSHTGPGALTLFFTGDSRKEN